MLLARIIQIACVLLLIGVMYGFGQGFLAVAGLFDGPGFPVGFICGGVLVFLVWWVSEKLEKSPRR
ncbi:hypothetical protein ACSV5K_09245 [Agrobacterium pusense]|uniref:hypothetical protein n=1 Tax=Agrobacterium pusense TaxID=648995 RepID=UPI003FD3CAAC